MMEAVVYVRVTREEREMVGVGAGEARNGREEHCVFLWDTETTGMDSSAKIVEIAVMEWDKPRRSIQRLVNPMKGIPNSHIHGIYLKDVVGADSFPVTWAEVVDYVEKVAAGRTPVFVAHNSKFDVRMLAQEVHQSAGKVVVPSNWKFACSITDATKIAWPTEGSYSIKNLCSKIGISDAHAHRALEDVKLQATILERASKEVGGEEALLKMLARRSKPIVERRKSFDVNPREYYPEWFPSVPQNPLMYYSLDGSKTYHLEPTCSSIRRSSAAATGTPNRPSNKSLCKICSNLLPTGTDKPATAESSSSEVSGFTGTRGPLGSSDAHATQKPITTSSTTSDVRARVPVSLRSETKPAASTREESSRVMSQGSEFSEISTRRDTGRAAAGPGAAHATLAPIRSGTTPSQMSGSSLMSWTTPKAPRPTDTLNKQGEEVWYYTSSDVYHLNRGCEALAGGLHLDRLLRGNRSECGRRLCRYCNKSAASFYTETSREQRSTGAEAVASTEKSGLAQRREYSTQKRTNDSAAMFYLPNSSVLHSSAECKALKRSDTAQLLRGKIGEGGRRPCRQCQTAAAPATDQGGIHRPQPAALAPSVATDKSSSASYRQSGRLLQSTSSSATSKSFGGYTPATRGAPGGYYYLPKSQVYHLSANCKTLRNSNPASLHQSDDAGSRRLCHNC